MDLKLILIGVIVLLCIILFLFVSKNKKNKRSKFLRPLFRLAEENNSQISKYECWNKSVIGIDELNNKVFVIKNVNKTETSQFINLADIQKCRVNKIGRNVSGKEGSIHVVDKIELVFINRDKTDITVEIYNAEYNSLVLSGELQLSEKWCKIVNDRITTTFKLK